MFLTIFVGQVCNGATYVNIDMLRNKKDGNLMLVVEGMWLNLLSLCCAERGNRMPFPSYTFFHSTYLGINSSFMYHRVLLVQFNLVLMV